MTHRRAVAAMVLVTLLWSIAGVVTRHLDAARSFEVTFWRSTFNALALVIALTVLRGGGALWRSLRTGGWPLWVSGLCWSVMFTAFMVAITLTTVANVLITMSLAPLATALLARIVLGERLAPRTWAAIVTAGAGIVWMFGHEAAGGQRGVIGGTLVALGVPLAAAINWIVLQHTGRQRPSGAPGDDMLSAVLIGATLSALSTWPLAVPFEASAHDLGLLAMLGVVQLALPCLIAVRVARVLPAPEVALLALLEVVLGVLWAWLGAAEQPSPQALSGGLLVLGALVANELLGMRLRRGTVRKLAS
jgi:drug/metabolite transporter (DMT)-like permease